MHGMCQKCCGISCLLTGALLLLNAFVWPQWLGIDGWVQFGAVLLVLCGFIKLVVPNKCPGCNAMRGCEEERKGKK